MRTGFDKVKRDTEILLLLIERLDARSMSVYRIVLDRSLGVFMKCTWIVGFWGRYLFGETV